MQPGGAYSGSTLCTHIEYIVFCVSTGFRNLSDSLRRPSQTWAGMCNEESCKNFRPKPFRTAMASSGGGMCAMRRDGKVTPGTPSKAKKKQKKRPQGRRPRTRGSPGKGRRDALSDIDEEDEEGDEDFESNPGDSSSGSSSGWRERRRRR